jgi:hypothetical protein
MAERKPLKPLMISLYDLLGTIENDKALYKYVESGNEIFVWNGRNYVDPVNDDDLIWDIDFADCKKPIIKILSYIYCSDTCEEDEDDEKTPNEDSESSNGTTSYTGFSKVFGRCC